MANDNVDTRIIRMEFDNKRFEKNIKQTSESLEELKQSLDFEDVEKSASKNKNKFISILTTLGNKVSATASIVTNTVKVKLSALQVAMTTTIANLTNRVINFGIMFTKSLSVDNISSGWNKFSEKTISVATMMAQKIRIAGQEITDLAERTAVVNEQLELLAWFSDETSYSFEQMVNNAGKFIAAGQDLDTSVKAMEGIATWAALAGQNASTASRAMYQLAQAMGKGKIQKIDWMSIQNANMDTEEFRETILATAVALGELKKEGDKFITKTGKKFTTSQFADFLSEGWFTSDVLMKGLNKYSAAVDQIYKLAEEKGLTASEVIEQYGDQLDAFGVKAFKAAQEARTFNDVINSVKDAVSSKWMKTFEYLIGGQADAVKTWTELANELYDVFAESGNFRNSILSVWEELGGRDDLFGEHGSSNQGAFWNLYDALVAVKNFIVDAWNTIFPLSEMESENDQAKDIGRTLKSITGIIKSITDQFNKYIKQSTIIKKVFETLFNIFRVGLFTAKAFARVLEPLIYTFRQLAEQSLNRIIKLFGNMDRIIEHISQIGEKLNSVLWKMIEIINPNEVLNSLFNTLSSIFKIISNFNILGEIVDLIDNFFDGLKQGGGITNNFASIMKSLLSLFNVVSKSILTIAKVIVKNLTPVLYKAINGISKLIGTISGVVVKVISELSKLIISFTDFISGIGSKSNIEKSLENFIMAIPKVLQKAIPIIKTGIEIFGSLIQILLAIPKAINAISIEFTGKGILDNIKEFFMLLKKSIFSFIENAEFKKIQENSMLTNVMTGLIVFLNGFKELLKGVLSGASAILVILGKALEALGKVLQAIFDIIIKIFRGQWTEMGESAKTILVTVGIVGAVITASVLLYNAFYKLMNTIDPLGSIVETISDLLYRIKPTWKIILQIISSLAKDILVFSIAMAVLNTVDKEILKIVPVIAGIAAGTIVVFKVLSSIVESIDKFGYVRKKIVNIFDTIVSLKKDVKEVTSTIMDLKQIRKLMRTITVVILEISAAALIFSKAFGGENGKLAKLAIPFTIITTVLIGMTIALTAMNMASNKLSKESNENSQKKVLALFEELSAFSLSLLATALSLRLVMSQLNDQIDWDKKLLATFATLAGLMGVIIGGVEALKLIRADEERTNEAVKMIVAISGSLTILAGALSILGLLNPGKIWSAAGVLTALLAAILGIMFLMSKITAVEDLGKIIGLIFALSGALLVLGSTLALLSSMYDPKMWAIVGVLTAVLGLFTITIAAIVKITAIAGAIDTASGALELMGMIIVGIELLLLGFNAMVIVVTASIVAFMFAITDLYHSLVDLLGRGNEVKELLQNTLPEIAFYFAQFAVMMASALGSIIQELLIGITEALGYWVIASLIPTMYNTIPDLTDAIIYCAKYVLTALETELPSILESAYNIHLVVLEFLEKVLNDVADALFRFLDRNSLKWAIGFLNFIRKLLKNIYDNSPLLQWVWNIVNQVVSIFNGIVTGVKETFDTLMTTAREFFFGFIDSVKRWFGLDGDKPEFVKIGENIMNGFINGLIDAWNYFKNKATGIFSKFVEWVQDTLGIASPSKVFAEIGSYIIQGFTNGLEDETNKQESVMKNTFGNISKVLADYLLNDSNDYTIKIGMDITNVEEQARNVRGIMSSISNSTDSTISGAYQASALRASGEIQRYRSSKSAQQNLRSDNVYNDNVTNNNVFNIKSSNPKEVANEIDRILKEKSLNSKWAKGGV